MSFVLFFIHLKPRPDNSSSFSLTVYILSISILNTIFVFGKIKIPYLFFLLLFRVLRKSTMCLEEFMHTLSKLIHLSLPTEILPFPFIFPTFF